MERLLVALDPNVGIEPVELAGALDDDIEARRLGLRDVALEGSLWRDLVPGVTVMVVVIVPTNITIATVVGIVHRLVVGLQTARSNPSHFKLTELTTGYGDPLIVVNLQVSGNR